MDDLISRKAAMKLIESESRMWGDEYGVIDVLHDLEDFPSAEPEKHTEERTETHACDLISRQAAIDAYGDWYVEEGTEEGFIGTVKQLLEGLPPAEPEIIHCKDCKYAEVADPEDGQDGYSCQFHRGSIWFSGSYCSWAERKENG